MKLFHLFESLLFPPAPPAGPGLPPPVEKRPGRPVATAKSAARLVDPVTGTFEWDLSRAHVKTGAVADLLDNEAAELEKRGLKNEGWNTRLKLARVQGSTAGEAAKAVGCSISYAGKVFAALSKFEGK